jgi:hypothetical protein
MDGEPIQPKPAPRDRKFIFLSFNNENESKNFADKLNHIAWGYQLSE